MWFVMNPEELNYYQCSLSLKKALVSDSMRFQNEIICDN